MSIVPEEIKRLVELFERNSEAYRNQAYNETQLRREFIDPFFEALGWDISNKAGYAEAYKDVIHEDAIKIGSATKAPDYCFRIGGARKFFLEAKKPSVSIKDDISPAYQLRRYAWSAKLPLSILTDFEEFAIYDCCIRPQPTDKTGTGRILYLTYKEYTTRWDEIASIFSKEAIMRGSFDKFAVSGKRKRGTSEVDAEFLTEIEAWRNTLARNIALRNADLSVRELNFAVQRTIDRIIFLRMCEDRGIEQYGQLQALLNGENTYGRLRHIYGLADDRYNSGLFHFKPEKERAEAPDELTPTIIIDDKVLKDIIRRLYYPESPYEFSVLSTDILGNVYEQFLGKVIRLTAGHRAVIEEKPEVKKAGGVYYTPVYIVDYIVKNTVGNLCEGKTPKQIAKFRILDPACGSGSFLMGAYSYLLNYHRDWYLENGPQKHTKAIYQGAGSQWFLTTQEKKRILLNNIYGVDIDSQAVEVTKLSLLLKVLEGENQDSLNRQLKMFRERALPDLGSNIKCGNSLIGPDYYEGRQATMFDDEETRRVNAFDWNAEFPQIMKVGGFDAMIGNPPYLFITEQEESAKQYFGQRYITYSYRYDVYGLFIEQAFNRLLGNDGCFGFIIPHTILNNDSFEGLRRFLLEKTALDSIIDLGPGVFQGAKNETMLLFARNCHAIKSHLCLVVKSDKDLTGLDIAQSVSQKWFLEMPKAAILVTANRPSIALLNKLRSIPVTLGDYCTVNQGLRTGNNQRYLSPIKKLRSHKLAVGGKDIQRYFAQSNLFVQYEPEKLDAPRKEAIFTTPEKLIVQEVRNITLPRRIFAAYDDHQLYCLQTTNVVNLKESTQAVPNLKYLLCLLNSTLLNWFFRLSFPSNNHIASNQLARLPIHPINFDDSTDKACQDKTVTLVERMLALHERLKDVKTPDDKTRLQRQIDVTDKQIDQLVYELYGLTEEEIRVVEGSTK